MADLKERYGGWALVTGASSGIGESFVRNLAARGFPVALVARRTDRMRALADEVHGKHGVETLVITADLSERESTAQVVAAIGEREVGMLVNNAGFGFSGKFLDVELDVYERMVKLNCIAPVALTHAFLPAMVERRRGAVVMVASIAGYQPTPFFAVYGATKAFDLLLGEALWTELRGSGVDVISLSPGETKTEFSSQAHFEVDPGGMTADVVAEAALRKLGGPPSVVPGLENKVAAFLHRIFPRGFTAEVTASVLAKRLQGKSKRELRGR